MLQAVFSPERMSSAAPRTIRDRLADAVRSEGSQADKMAGSTAQKAMWLWAIPAVGVIVCAAWAALLAAYRELNRAKYAVLAQLEADLPVPPFIREREIYKIDKRTSLSQIERWIPACFILLYATMLAAAFLR